MDHRMILDRKTPDASRRDGIPARRGGLHGTAFPALWLGLMAPTETLAQQGVTPSPNVSENVGEAEMAWGWVWGGVAVIAIIVVAVILVRRRR